MIYHVFANRTNIGDWLSARAIQMLLGSSLVAECLCDAPYVNETIDQLSKATEEDLIIIGGGGLLMDYFMPFWRDFAPIAGRVPFCIWGIGHCDLKGEPSLPSAPLIGQVLKSARLIYVRDELTRSYLPGCRIPPPVPCPSVNLISPAPVKGKDILHVVNYSTAGALAYESMCRAGEEYAAELGVLYRETNNRVKKNDLQELDRVLSMYERSAIVISSALHGCVIGLAMGLKVLAISGDRKIEAFMEALGLGDWVLDTSEIGQISNRLANIHLQRQPAYELSAIRQRNIDIASGVRRMIPLLSSGAIVSHDRDADNGERKVTSSQGETL